MRRLAAGSVAVVMLALSPSARAAEAPFDSAAVVAKAHLHFHLQNGPTLFAADGLPAPFTDYVADGKPVERGEPVRGQIIERKP